METKRVAQKKIAQNKWLQGILMVAMAIEGGPEMGGIYSWIFINLRQL